MWESSTSVANFYGVEQKNNEKKFQFGDYVLWFPKGEKTHLGFSRKDGLVHSLNFTLL